MLRSGSVSADQAVGNGSPYMSTQPQMAITTGGTVNMKTGPGFFYGAANVATSAQLASVTCYDNPSAASGPVLYVGTLGLAGYSFPNNGGEPFVNGLTCNSATLIGSGVAIYYR